MHLTLGHALETSNYTPSSTFALPIKADRQIIADCSPVE